MSAPKRQAPTMDRNLALEVVRVTEAAALSASLLMGRGDEKQADQAGVDAIALGGQLFEPTDSGPRLRPGHVVCLDHVLRKDRNPYP